MAIHIINIKDLREKASLSQDEFSHLMGVSKRTVAYWESGEKTPHPRTLRKINELLENRTVKKPSQPGDKLNRERAMIKVLLHQVATLTAEVSILRKDKEPISRGQALEQLKEKTNLVIDDLEDF